MIEVPAGDNFMKSLVKRYFGGCCNFNDNYM